MHAKNNSIGPPSSSGSALIPGYLEHTGEAVVAVYKGQKIVAFRGAAKP